MDLACKSVALPQSKKAVYFNDVRLFTLNIQVEESTGFYVWKIFNREHCRAAT